MMFLASCGRAVAQARVEPDHGLQVGAAAGQLERHRAAEAVADGGDAAGSVSGWASSTSSPARPSTRVRVGVSPSAAPRRAIIWSIGIGLPPPW